MRAIETIINETINSYLINNLLIEETENTKKDEDEKRFRKKAIKTKGGVRKDFDVENDKKYNKNADDQEQSSVKDVLLNGFVNIKKVAEELYPDHTPEGAQSQLRKKLKGEKSDSGSTYKLKTKEVKRLRHIIAADLNQ